MCGNCIMEAVKGRVLDRRGVLRAGAAVATGALLAAEGLDLSTSAKAQTPAEKSGGTSVHDLTHELVEDFPTFFGEKQLQITNRFNYAQHRFNLNVWTLNEHTGTHVDAPLHFSADGQSVAEIPVNKLVAPLVIVDIREKAAAHPDAQLTPDDIRAWVSRNGPIPPGACVAMRSGWDAFVTGPKFRNADDKKVMHFPGFHVEATQMLAETSQAVGIAVDTLSLDYGPSPDFAAHVSWLPTGRWGLECVANLGALPERGATLVVGAPKIKGATGGPARVFAFT